MFSNRVFQIAFLISFITHGVMLFQNSNLSLFSTNQKEQKLEVSYLKNQEQPKKDTPPITLKKEPLLKLPSRVTVGKRIPPPFIDKEAFFRGTDKAMDLQQSLFAKPLFIKPDVIAIKKKITLPPIDIDKITNPSYISYYQLVREKIKRAAYQNYTRTETGEVYLSFIISADGSLKEIQTREEKSTSSPYLKEIALRSIKDASPFTAFPQELDYAQLSFNVVISFEIE